MTMDRTISIYFAIFFLVVISFGCMGSESTGDEQSAEPQKSDAEIIKDIKRSLVSQGLKFVTVELSSKTLFIGFEIETENRNKILTALGAVWRTATGAHNNGLEFEDLSVTVGDDNKDGEIFLKITTRTSDVLAWNNKEIDSAEFANRWVVKADEYNFMGL